jgi:iron complex outermembrane recepter protein
MNLKKSYLMMAPAIVLLAQPAFAQQLEEVIVTATKRATSVMDTPLSMEVMTGETIAKDNILNVEEMTQRMPSVVIGGNIQNNSVNIRGMGSGTNRAFEQSVAMFIDETYYPRSKSYRAPFFDIARAEVLRGPQAVLFGINATAGTVNIHTATTNPGDEAFLSLTGEYETEYSGYGMELVGGTSVGDSLGVRLALKYADQDDGWFENGLTGEDEGTFEELIARLTLAWEINENALLVTKVSYADAEESGDIGENNLSDSLPSAGALGAFIDDDYDWKRYVSDSASRAVTSDEPGFDHDLLSVSMKLDWQIGSGTLTAVAAYAQNDFDQVRNTHAFASDVNGATGGFDILTNIVASGAIGAEDAAIFAPPNPAQLGTNAQGNMFTEEYEQTSLEVRWTSDPDQRLAYIIGAYFDTSELYNINESLSGPVLGGWSAGYFEYLVSGTVQPTTGVVGRPGDYIDTDTLSAFGMLTWNISESFRLSFGGRYTDVTKDVAQKNEGKGCTAYTGYDVETQSHTGEVNVDHLYAAGFLSAECGRGLGAKDEFSSDNFMPEIIAQWDASDDIATYAKVATSAKSGGLVPSAAGRGLDPFDDEEALGYEVGVKTSFAAGRGQFNLAIFRTEFDDLQVTSFVSEPGQPVVGIVGNAAESVSQGVEVELNYAAADWLTLGTSLGYLDSTYDDFETGPCHRLESGDQCDLSGEDTPFAPEYSGSIYADASYPISASLLLDAGVVLSFRDSYYTNGALDPLGQQDSYEMWDARIGLSDADGKWSVSAIGKNLTEEAVLTGGTPFLGYIGVIGAPRTLTLQATYNF